MPYFSHKVIDNGGQSGWHGLGPHLQVTAKAARFALCWGAAKGLKKPTNPLKPKTAMKGTYHEYQTSL